MNNKNFSETFNYHLRYTLASDKTRRTNEYNLKAFVLTLKEEIINIWENTKEDRRKNKRKNICYLSLEFLIGRLLTNNLINLGLYDDYKKALKKEGIELDTLKETEKDAGLGNGGLGRLAACFLDSLSSLGCHSVGYGIRYNYGIFRQEIENGYQKEQPDEWMVHGTSVWEIPRDEIKYPVYFGGRVETTTEKGRLKFIWHPEEIIDGMAYDMPIVGYDKKMVNTLRLWSAKAREEFNFNEFNGGDYTEAVRKKIAAENISQVLYPDDTQYNGKVLRLKQQYFFVACSLHDIISRFKYDGYKDLSELHKHAQIQLNDTHPSIAIAELMRILLDEYFMDWEESWDIVKKTFSYTNHTLLPEALEQWDLELFSRLLPRHTQIIFEINKRFLENEADRCSLTEDEKKRVSIINEDGRKSVRMANLAIVGSKKVNGVAALHSLLLKTNMFPEYSKIYPNKFINVTNGVTHRRWLLMAFPEYASLITKAIGDGWIKDYSQIKKLLKFASDSSFQQEFVSVKNAAKERFASVAKDKWGLKIDTSRLFDTQCKRIHEYKRQNMNIFDVISIYSRLKTDSKFRNSFTPVNVFFAGKAAPGYVRAKEIIKLINNVSKVVNEDKTTNKYLKVYFLPNYDVSMAEILIPASNLSQQISTAGKEASGTGNMKFMINGAITLGTLDGANVEIKQEVGDENIFIFGKNSDEIMNLFKNNYNPYDFISKSAIASDIFNMVDNNIFSENEGDIFSWVKNSSCMGADNFAVWADIDDYDKKRLDVYKLYSSNKSKWNKIAITNTALSGFFSSDRTIKDYMKNIWEV